MGEIRRFAAHVLWTDEELATLQSHYAICKRDDLAEMFPSRNIRSVECKANSLGLMREKKPRRTAEETREAKRKHMAAKRAANIDAARAYQRSHHAKNKARHNALLREWHGKHFFRSRATKVDASGIDLAKLWKWQRGLCALTGRRLDRKAQLDHILPKARGGSDQISNLRWVCAEVNIVKRHLTDDELLAVCGDVMAWIGQRIAMVEAVG